jgi:hypothetical protein
MTITIQSEGRRHYLIGDTYPIRSAVKSAGCKWDPDRKAWWTGKYETAEELLGNVGSGSIKAECSWRKIGSEFLVAAPAGMAAKVGDKVTVRKASGEAKEVTLGAEVQPGLFEAAKEPRRQADNTATRQSLALVGERADLVSDFEATKFNREPHRKMGESCWLNLSFAGSKRPLAVIVVGYEPAKYYSANEDFGDYSGFRGYRGHLYYRPATREEYSALLAKSARENPITPEEWSAQ